MFDLNNKVAVITGAGGVLCSQMARNLSKNGVKCALLDLNFENVEKLSKELENSIPVKCNVLEKDSIQVACDKVIEEFGKIDILINGAGGNNSKATTTKDNFNMEDINNPYNEVKTFFDLEASGFEFVFNLNILGTLLPTQIFASKMVEKGGVIINISSMNAFTPLTRIPAYSAAKAGISNFTQWLAVHFAPVNIRVNALAPGFFLTEQNRFLLTNEDGSLTQRGDKIISHTPMAKFGKPEDLDGALIYLVSDEASFVTGVVLPIDGGFNAYSGV